MADLGRLFVDRIGPRFGEIRPEGARPLGSGIPDGEELIFEVLVGELRFLDNIFAIKQGAGLMVSLREMTNLLGFAIEFGGEPGVAAGWFIREANTFELDYFAGRVVVAGELLELDPDRVAMIGNVLYLHSDVFAEWFGIGLGIDFPTLTVTLQPREPLPQQERRSRVEAFEQATASARRPPELPLLDHPYQLASPPFVSIQVGAQRFIRPGASPESRFPYSVLGLGELAFASSRFFVSGSDDQILSNLRLTLGRDDPAGGLLGPLQATQVEAGDLSGAFGGGFGRGIAITNAPLGSFSATSNTTEFTGDIDLGWDVELYRGSDRPRAGGRRRPL